MKIKKTSVVAQQVKSREIYDEYPQWSVSFNGTFLAKGEGESAVSAEQVSVTF